MLLKMLSVVFTMQNMRLYEKGLNILINTLTYFDYISLNSFNILRLVSRNFNKYNEESTRLALNIIRSALINFEILSVKPFLDEFLILQASDLVMNTSRADSLLLVLNIFDLILTVSNYEGYEMFFDAVMKKFDLEKGNEAINKMLVSSNESVFRKAQEFEMKWLSERD